MFTPRNEYEAWLSGLTLAQVSNMLGDNGCSEAFVKSLSSNDNSKQQIYLASDLAQISKIPFGDPISSKVMSNKPNAAGKVKFQSSVNFDWITPIGPRKAPQAKLIYYPQYPEVRFSGFLADCDDPPSWLLNRELRGAELGRTLILAPTGTGRVWGLVLPTESSAGKELNSLRLDKYGLLSVWRLSTPKQSEVQPTIFSALCEISSKGFVDSMRLDKNGNKQEYNKQNGGGYTLEALLGIKPNGDSRPDYQGWEVKQHGVTNLDRAATGKVTMFTPEPDGGSYVGSVESFLRCHGTRTSDSNRIDFSHIYKCPQGWNETTGLRLTVVGYTRGQLVSDQGQIVLEHKTGEVAASWSFEKLLGHWTRKHAKAVFVPSLSQTPSNGVRQYRYGSSVIEGIDATFTKFLDAVSDGTIYYDPAVNMKRSAEGEKWSIKRRNQFRTDLKTISAIYKSVRLVEVCNEA